MAFCKSCGAPLTNESKFCQNCGAKTSSDGQAAAAGVGVGGCQDSSACKNAFTDTKDHTDEFLGDEVANEKVVCGISYLWILFFLPLVTYPNSQYARFHANQSLLVLIASAILGAVGSIASSIIYGMLTVPAEIFDNAVTFTFFPHLISGIITAVCSLGGVALALFGLINTLNGKSKELPLIGHFRIIK